MKYVDGFRDPAHIFAARDALKASCQRPWTVMEVCGGQTHSIARHAIRELLPEGLELVHGPGCPVCVTPLEMIGAARKLALRTGLVLCTFGDMLRVPGPDGDLLGSRALGADVRVMLSPLDAVELARKQPDTSVVFFGVGFETTAPATAMAVHRADTLGLSNFSLLAAHVRVPPAMELILSSPENRVQGFLAAGHVCTVSGTGEYPDIAARHGVPIAITGFEPLDILLGLLAVVRQLEAGRAEVENCYERAVRPEGNPVAKRLMEQVFELADRPFRGLGVVRAGGLTLRPELARFDAAKVHRLKLEPVPEPAECQAALVLQGRLSPPDCPAFGTRCTPDAPLGAPMVSTEGACAAYYRYRKQRDGKRDLCQTTSD